MYNLILFSLGSLGIFILSWTSLGNPHSHGFFRFFAFETLLLLIISNLDSWFRDPFSLRQILSWIALLASLFLAIHGFSLLRRIGQPEGPVEQTTRLVTVGAYRYIRHPLYSSLLWLALGAFLKNPSLAGGGLFVGVLAFLMATARVEEAENLQRFGGDYAAYMRVTRMFIPFLF